MILDYFDIHSHINFPEYDEDREDVIGRLEENNTMTMVVGTDLKSSKEAIDLADKNKNIFACIGVHPADNTTDDFDSKDYLDLIKNEKVLAIGECGLDYFRIKGDEEEEKKRQKEIFIKQIEFALEYDRPLMLHCRDSYKDVIDILKTYTSTYGEKLRGNSHFFAGDVDIARQFLDLGFTMSFTGVISFTHDYDEVIKFIPKDMIHAETDSPFVAPVPFRGKRCEPIYVKQVVENLAKIKEENVDSLRKTLFDNSVRVFKPKQIETC